MKAVAGLASPAYALLRAAIAQNQIGWQQHHGAWFDIGTPQRLQELAAQLL